MHATCAARPRGEKHVRGGLRPAAVYRHASKRGKTRRAAARGEANTPSRVSNARSEQGSEVGVEGIARSDLSKRQESNEHREVSRLIEWKKL
jgi:hypothetical protein